MYRLGAILLTMAMLPTAAAQTSAANDVAALYDALRGIRLDPARALNVDGLSLARGPATIHLEHGVWIPLQAVQGHVTGAVFLGDGRFSFTPPPGIEQDQLAKFSGSKMLDEAFTAAYLRFTDDTADQIAMEAVEASVTGDLERARKIHEDLREDLLDKQGFNLEARLLQNLVNGRQDGFFAWIDTREHGLLSLRSDVTEADRYRLLRWADRYGGMLDVWSALGPEPLDAALPRHYAIDMTLDGEELVEERTTLRLQAIEPETTALHFSASPLLEVRQVLDADGAPLFFTRERTGRNEWEPTVRVFFAAPLPTDAPTEITFVCGGDIVDSYDAIRSGRYALKAPVGWYPALGYLKRATYEMTFRVDEDEEVFASGEMLSDEVIEDTRVVRFRQASPVGFTSFNYGSMEMEEVDIEGAPPIIVFGNSGGMGGTRRARNVGIDVGNSLNYFSQMFGPYPFPYMYVTLIPYAHGQGFPGLLHLAASTFSSSVKGVTEAFRGHETAHQWWGHIVGWKSYRDQWLSEGFAEYSGALYAAWYHRDDEILADMTDAWRHDITGTGTVRAVFGYERYGYPPQMMRYSQGSASGPISIGSRLASGEAPIDYNILVYEKGAYVLHMLRMLFFDLRAGNDEPFRNMMRDFVATFRGKEATTEDFRRVVERHAGGDMGWFFDQWVYGTGIPTYRYAWTTGRADDGAPVLRLRVRQTVEPEAAGLFDMPVPLRVEFGDDRASVVRLRINQAEHLFEFPLPLAPTDVVLNHANAVLADVIKENW